ADEGMALTLEELGRRADLHDLAIVHHHDFVGYFIGSPGMNFMPAKVEGRTVRVGEHALTLDYAPKTSAAAKVELGIRPE
ncbi:hypothetical protein ACC705_35360, partial [Rhizobium ruizarguesonis]